MSCKKIRIMEINEQNSNIIINDSNQFNKPTNKTSSVNFESSFIFIPLMLFSIVLIISFSLILYYQNTLTLSNKHQQPTQLTIQQANNRKTLNAFSESREPIKKEQTRIYKLNRSIINYYRQKVKKSSPQISIQKLNRAYELYRNLTQPIDPVYIKQEEKMFMEDYNIYAYEEKPICVVVPTYNNVKQNRYKKNIDSILNQIYDNYRVIIIDDASTDNTSQAISEYIKEHENYINGKIKITKNLQRKMALENILDAARNFCKPEEIFIVVDGDDYLLGKLVFKLFNYGFSDPMKWVVYSNFLTVNGKIGYSREYPMQVIRDNQFRNVYFIISHLRAFYTKLLLLIDPQDLTNINGTLFHAANDVAIFMPILQMSGHHILYLHQINYYYNSNTGMNNHNQKKKQQMENDLYIRTKPRYYQLQSLFQNTTNQSNFYLQHSNI